MRILRSALILSVALGLSASASATTCPGPDAGGYSCATAASATFAPTTSGNLFTCDDCTTTRAIGFTYNHYGVPATTVGITSNGFMQVGASGGAFAGYCTYPVGVNPGYVGRYDDLYPPGGGTVTDGVSGVAPNRIYAVQWTNVPHYPGGFGFTTFQIQLHENGGPGGKAAIAITLLGNSLGDMAHQNIAMTQGLDYDPCNGFSTVPLTVTFSKPSSTGTGCDLSPIEAKLDDGTRWTNDAERNTQTTTINNNTNTSNTTQTNNILNSINPNIARVEAKLDDGTRFTSDTERTNLQNALVGEINQNETKIDRLETKLDDERRFTDDTELGALEQNLSSALDALEVKLDNLEEVTENLQTQLQIETEHGLGEDTNVNRPMAIFVLPAANGGRLEEVRDIVDRTINNMVAAGCAGAAGARPAWDAGNVSYAGGQWDEAYVHYADAYKAAATAPCN